MTDSDQQQIESLEQELRDLEADLVTARESVQSWTQASSDLSRSAAEARAKNQGSGRGIVGALLGSKFRSAMRAGAAASNAAIAKEVAQKRSAIAEGKARAQGEAKSIQAEISSTKTRIRELKAQQKASVRSSGQRRAKAGESVGLLHKLKEAHELGLLTDDEYEQKRLKIVDGI